MSNEIINEDGVKTDLQQEKDKYEKEAYDWEDDRMEKGKEKLNEMKGKAEQKVKDMKDEVEKDADDWMHRI